MKRIINRTAVKATFTSLSTRKVLVGGCFDVVHIGHVRFLKAAKREGGVLIVALEPDSFIEKKKGRTPFHTQKERAEILSSFSMVDYVVLLPTLLNEKGYGQLVVDIHPHTIGITEGDSYRQQKEEHALLVGARVVPVISLLKGKSSTEQLRHEST